MASPTSVEEFLDLVRKSGVADEKRLDGYLQKLRAAGRLPSDPSKLASLLVYDGGVLTLFQAEHIMQGKWRRFNIGKYKVLEKLGSGGMGTVFLCEHKLMRCLRAIKILPAAKAQDEAALGRFYREARAVAAIDHPNIVHAYDIDQDENLHFLVMEYVDGSSLQDIVKKAGPVSVLRACHYMRQSAIGLDHAERAGLVHRDIKPGNILVARDGSVKILDMGLARFFNDDDDILTKKFDENVLGTADYLAPEQALDSHTVDIRADIYSLGATFYFLLTGKTPFGEGTVAQKLFWHQSRNPKPVRDLRPEVPAEVEAVITKMMAKDPANRYQMPAEVADALAPLTQTPIGPPPESEMPRLSPAATGKATDGSHHDAGEPTAITSRPETPPRALQKMAATATATTKTSRPPVNVAPACAAPVTGAPARQAPAPAPAPAPSPRTAGTTKPAPPPPAPAAAPQPVVRSAVTAQTAVVAPPPPAALPRAQPGVAVDADEEFAWQGLASETEDLTAAANDTGPAQSKARPAAAVGERRAVAREKNIVLLVVALMVVAGLLGAVVAGAFVLYSFLTTPPDAQANVPAKLLVSQKDGGKQPGVYKTITAALRVAPKDAVIEITDDIIEENVLFEYHPSRSTEVTLQAAPGKEVVWRSKSKNPDDKLLQLTGAAFFKLKGPGLILDGELGDKVNAKDKEKGKNKVGDLIYIMGSSHGLTIEDVQARNFDRSAVCVISAAGDDKSPIQIKGVTALTGPADKEGSVIFIDVKANMRIKQVDGIVVEGVQGPAGLPASQLIHCGNGALGDRLVQIPGLKRD
jgi:eukaryotic-like serine/threonine-protein kinase